MRILNAIGQNVMQLILSPLIYSQKSFKEGKRVALYLGINFFAVDFSLCLYKPMP